MENGQKLTPMEEEVDIITRRKRLYWSNLGKQALLNLSYLLMAFSSCLRGPTLLDLQEIYETSVETISLCLTVMGIGGLIGAVCIVHIWRRCHSHKYFVLFTILTFMSLGTASLPHLGHVWAFGAMIIFIGAFISSLNTVVNVLCLEIWRGFNGGPYMHSMHFSFSLGALLAPFAAKPFLSPRVYTEEEDNNSTTVVLETDQSDAAVATTNITLLYPLTGLCLFLPAIAFLFLGLLERQQAISNNGIVPASQTPTPAPLTRSAKFLVFLIFLFAVIYIGLEWSMLLYVPVFAVKSAYNLSKAEGANLLALVLAPYASARLITVFLAAKFTPTKILLLNGTMVTLGTVLQLVAGEENLLLTRVGCAVVGYGMGSTMGNMWMWLRQYMEVTSGVASLINVGAGLGINITLLVGNLIDFYPMVLMYLQAVVVVMSIVIFTLAHFVGVEVLKESKRKEEEDMRVREKLNN